MWKDVQDLSELQSILQILMYRVIPFYKSILIIHIIIYMKILNLEPYNSDLLRDFYYLFYNVL